MTCRDTQRQLAELERELDAEREAEYRRLKAERFGSPVEPFVQTTCLNCGGSLLPNMAGFLVHQGIPNCTTPTVHIVEVQQP